MDPVIRWTGLNTSNLLIILPPYMATAIGHMGQEINHIQSTTPETTIDIEEIQNRTPIPDLPNTKSYDFFPSH